MAGTKLSDVIIPSVFAGYVVEKVMEKSALVQSGIAATDAQIQALANGGGSHVNLPYFNDLTGDAEVINDTDSLTVNKVTADQDIAVKMVRGKAWGGHDLVTVMAGADPLAAVANRVADFWVRQEQKTLIANLAGVFGGAMASHVLDVSATDGLSGAAMLDAKQILGDAGDSIAAVAMHSAKYTELQKQNLIATVRDSEGNVQFNTYLGYRILVDDALPFANAKYTTYMFGQGAVAYANVNVPNQIEFDRNSLGNQDIMITRKGWVTHVRGIKWNSSAANPTNTDLATAANWTRVYDPKAIRVVAIISK